MIRNEVGLRPWRVFGRFSLRVHAHSKRHGRPSSRDFKSAGNRRLFILELEATTPFFSFFAGRNAVIAWTSVFPLGKELAVSVLKAVGVIVLESRGGWRLTHLQMRLEERAVKCSLAYPVRCLFSEHLHVSNSLPA